LSVRETEKLLARSAKPVKTARALDANAHYDYLEKSLQARLGTRVSLKRRGRRGSITITFVSDDDLQRLLELLGVAAPTVD
jgi:ParB family chromosome partitioning protein